VVVLAATLVIAGAGVARAQTTTDAANTRAGTIEAQQQAKVSTLHPYEPNKAEIWVKKLEEQFLTGSLHWHPFFTSAYSGGGFTLGAGYLTHVGSYNTVDFRGSWTPSGYLRAESEFIAPRLFDRRGHLSVIGGWRKATQVGFYGFGTGETSQDDRANYGFTQPYASATLDFRPTRRVFVLTGAAEYSQWDQRSGDGAHPSVEEIYTPAQLPGLGEKVTYLHLAGTAAIDWRTSPGYSRRGGYYAITFNNFNDQDDIYSFKRVDYEVIQHIPILREAWVLSLHGRVQTASTKGGDEVPFFMMPALGGGSSLRGYASWRFRDMNSLLLQAEWRVLVNSFMDVALFYDAGKVEARAQDLDLNGLKSDFGIGFRLHGPAATPVRIELAKSNEGLALVFAASASF
jgi:hypothetical protein